MARGEHLEVTLDPDALYRSLGRGESPNRPVFTADVYDLDDSHRVIIAEHPCSMRRGTELRDTLLVAPVERHDAVPVERLETGFFDRFPLPDLDGEGTFSFGQLGELHRMSRGELTTQRRLSCMLPLGVNRFRQRLVWYLARFFVSTAKLEEAFARYYEEADIIEKCLDRAAENGGDLEEATVAIDEALGRPGESGSPRRPPESMRDLLADPQQRPYVRREMSRWANERFG